MLGCNRLTLATCELHSLQRSLHSQLVCTTYELALHENMEENRWQRMQISGLVLLKRFLQRYPLPAEAEMGHNR